MFIQDRLRQIIRQKKYAFYSVYVSIFALNTYSFYDELKHPKILNFHKSYYTFIRYTSSKLTSIQLIIFNGRLKN